MQKVHLSSYTHLHCCEFWRVFWLCASNTGANYLRTGGTRLPRTGSQPDTAEGSHRTLQTEASFASGQCAILVQHQSFFVSYRSSVCRCIFQDFQLGRGC